MELMITNKSDRAVEITNGKQTMYAYAYKCGSITVLNFNASHRAYRGAGRTFEGWTDALDGYKSSFMKSALELARDELAA